MMNSTEAGINKTQEDKFVILVGFMFIIYMASKWIYRYCKYNEMKKMNVVIESIAYQLYKLNSLKIIQTEAHTETAASHSDEKQEMINNKKDN